MIVAGMHRSGTSIVALGLKRLGVVLVDDVEAPADHNPAGYGEDKDFVAFHRRMFDRSWADPGDPDLGHHHDWGYDPAETFDPSAFDAVAGDARALLDREAATTPWGWKDPRTTLVLDRWVALLDDPRVLLVVRHPDAVASSMADLGPSLWRDPVWAHRIWRFYNRRLLAFARTAKVPCLVVDGGLATASVTEFADVVNDGLGLALDPSGVVFDHVRHDRFDRDAPRHRLPMTERAASDLLWRRLRRTAAWRER